MSSLQLFPEVIDGSTLGQKYSTGVALPIGVEGQKDADGSANVNALVLVSRDADAIAAFGAVSKLTILLKYLLDRGAGPVWAVASASGSGPTLVQRQAAWQTLEAKREIRIRLTDSTTTADHTALAISCDNANLINNKQFCIVGMAAGTTKAQLLTGRASIASKRAVLVGPAVYDEHGVLQSGAFHAASIAAMVAQNEDIADDMDTATIPKLTGMEKDSLGNDLFREIVVAGSVVNDFEDLLQGGVSPAMPGINGGLAISHLRMTYTTDSTFDSLMTRLIMDQVFVVVRDYAIRFNSLRRGNSPSVRGQLQSGLETLLGTLRDWISPVVLGADGSRGYGVVVTASSDNRQQIISYSGEVIRGAQTILVQGNLTIAA